MNRSLRVLHITQSIFWLLVCLVDLFPGDAGQVDFETCSREDDSCNDVSFDNVDTPLGLSLLQRAAGIVGSEDAAVEQQPVPLLDPRHDFEDAERTNESFDFGFTTQPIPLIAQPTHADATGLSKQSVYMSKQMAQTSMTTTLAQTNHTTTFKVLAASVAGVSANAVGDGTSFMISLGTYSGMVIVCFLFFSLARLHWKRSYLNDSPVRLEPSNTFFGWMHDSLKLTSPQIMQIAGIDHAMLLDYCVLCVKVLLLAGLPLVLIEIPLNIWAGGNAAGQDHLSWQGMANVKDGGPLYWFYAALVWWVVCITQILIFGGMHRFVKLRFEWASEMPPPQHTTIMVDNIPREVASTDAELRKYFNAVFREDVVVAAVLVKDTREKLLPAWNKLKADKMALDDANQQFINTKIRPTEEIARLEMKIQDTKKVIIEERKRIEANSVVPGNSTNSASGFVTFRTTSQAAAALNFDYTEDGDYFIVEHAPEPGDVIYSDLLVDPTRARIDEIIGYGILALYFAFFLPVVLFISCITELATIEKYFPWLAKFVKKEPIFAEIWNGLFGSLALTTLMSLLPTLIALVFTSLFVLRSEGTCQYKMQQVYFFFLVTFVLLVTAIGSSLVDTIEEILRSPFKIFSLLANSLPTSSHFYLSYVLTNCGTCAMNLTRHMNLLKFIVYSQSSSEETARAKSEPEDPTFYGMGSRSARITLIMVICLVFCTLSPLIIILGLLYFCLGRLVYGYLFIYAETIKPDFGGAFYVRSLYHTQFGLGLYIVLMSGVLYERASNEGPGCVALLALVPLIWSYLRFDRRFKWDKTPNDHLQMNAGKEVRRRKCDRSNYVQPELIDPLEPGKAQHQAFSSLGINIPYQESISNSINSTFSSLKCGTHALDFASELR